MNDDVNISSSHARFLPLVKCSVFAEGRTSENLGQIGR